MGILSSIGKVVFGDPTKDIRAAEKAKKQSLRQAETYLRNLDALPLQYRDEAMQSLGGYFMGDAAAQQAMLDKVQASPLYGQMIEAGEEAVMRNAAMTGGLRSGTTSQNLARVNQSVLQNLLNQQLQGQAGFMNPNLNTQGITNMITGFGDAAAQARMAQANAEQGLAGQALQAILAGVGAASGAGMFGGGGGGVGGSGGGVGGAGPLPGTTIPGTTGNFYSGFPGVG